MVLQSTEIITIEKNKLEKLLNLKLKDNIISLGVDPASKTGWSTVNIENGKVKIDYGVISVNSNDFYFKFDRIIEFFETLIEQIKLDKKEKIVIIEDCWLGHNVAALKMLARISMIVYVICFQNSINKKIISPLASRSNLGFKGRVKKEIFQKEVLNKLKFNMTDRDAIDALVLALNGVLCEKH